MTKYSKYNVVYRLQKWMDSVPGQTFLNYAYSWGASIVILGTLFKLTHLPGANLMLFLGMGTEVVVFFLSAFDRPFDKTTIGMDLKTHAGEETEEVQDNLEGTEMEGSEGVTMQGGGTVIIGSVGGQGGYVPQEGEGGQVAAAVGGGGVILGGGGVVGGGVVGDGSGEGVVGGAPVIGAATIPAWVDQQQQVSPEMAEATSNYVEELKKLTEMLGAVSEQSARLTRDSEEMENLNRTLTGICKVYEMQLKSASQQIGTIDQINDQSKKMAQQIEQLNKIYARMIEAMTVNMRSATPAAPNNESII
ncbi:MAG: gliding motility protein GldL [Prevotella sp.]|nr:gliding motility protein GldL [Prevotella sp.]